MGPLRMMQAGGTLVLLAAFICPRIPRLRPHLFRIMQVAVGLYVAAAVGVVIWRIAAGPGPFME